MSADATSRSKNQATPKNTHHAQAQGSEPTWGAQFDNLPASFGKDDLVKLCAEFGTIVSSKVAKQRTGGYARAYCNFSAQDSARRCIAQLNGMTLPSAFYQGTNTERVPITVKVAPPPGQRAQQAQVPAPASTNGQEPVGRKTRQKRSQQSRSDSETQASPSSSSQTQTVSAQMSQAASQTPAQQSSPAQTVSSAAPHPQPMIPQAQQTSGVQQIPHPMCPPPMQPHVSPAQLPQPNIADLYMLMSNNVQSQVTPINSLSAADHMILRQVIQYALVLKYGTALMEDDTQLLPVVCTAIFQTTMSIVQSCNSIEDIVGKLRQSGQVLGMLRRCMSQLSQ